MVPNQKNRYSLISLFSLLGAVILSTSCSESLDPGNGYGVEFLPRTSDYVYLNPMILKTDGQGYTYVERLNESSVPVDKFILRANVTSLTGDVLDYSQGTTSPDPILEKELLEAYGLDGSSHGSAIIFIEYRKEVCHDIVFTADKEIFGVKPGEPLNDWIEFYTHPDQYQRCILSQDKKAVAQIATGMTLKEYLSYHPIIFSDAYFRFKEIPAEIPSEVSFSVRIELEEGKILNRLIAVNFKAES